MSLALTIALARMLFEGKTFVRSDGVRAVYSAWQETAEGGRLTRTLRIPGVDQTVEVTEVFADQGGIAVMIEDVPLAQKRSTFAATPTASGGLLYLPLPGVDPGFVSSECWVEAGKTTCELRRKNPDGTVAVIGAREAE